MTTQLLDPNRTLAVRCVSDAMHHGVVTCSPDTPLPLVARLMAEHRIHCVVVSRDTDIEPWGVVSDLDLVAAGDLHGLTARAIAATVPPGESLTRAVQLMVEHAVSHLIVADPAQHVPLGILSTLDVARVLAR